MAMSRPSTASTSVRPGARTRGRLARVHDHDGAGLLDEQVDPLDVVVVRVGDERGRDLQLQALHLGQQPVDLPGRVDDGRLARLRAVEDLAEVLQAGRPPSVPPRARAEGRPRRCALAHVASVVSVEPAPAYLDPTRTVTAAAPTLSALSQARTVTACGPGGSGGSFTREGLDQIVADAVRGREDLPIAAVDGVLQAGDAGSARRARGPRRTGTWRPGRPPRACGCRPGWAPTRGSSRGRGRAAARARRWPRRARRSSRRAAPRCSSRSRSW